MLDERQSIGIAIRIIVLNHDDLLCFGAVSWQETADWNGKKTFPKAETRDQAESTDPANGQTGKKAVRQRHFSRKRNCQEKK